jgi:hypothetical protein
MTDNPCQAEHPNPSKRVHWHLIRGVTEKGCLAGGPSVPLRMEYAYKQNLISKPRERDVRVIEWRYAIAIPVWRYFYFYLSYIHVHGGS